jgi:3-oxoacyl-[acyl-carrier-protein] synthase III
MQENLEKVMTELKMKNSYIVDYKNLYPNGTKNVNILEHFAKKINLKEATNPYYILIDEKGNTIAASYELKQIKKHLN